LKTEGGTEMKRFVTIILALTMVLTMCAPVYADETTTEVPDTPVAPVEPAELTAAQVKAIKPAAKAASYSYTKIKVSWDKIEDLDGYKVYRATKKTGKYSLIKTVTNPSTTSYINTGRTIGKTYWYKVKGYKKIDGKTVYTKYSTVKSAVPRLSTVKITKVYLPKDFQTRVKWNKVSGATGYQVYRKRTDQSKWKLMKTVSSKYNYATDLMKGNLDSIWGGQELWDYEDIYHDWEYKVRAIRKSGGKTYYGYFSKPCKYQQDWTIKEIQKELIAYGESFEFPMYAFYDDNGNEVDSMNPEGEFMPKKDGSTYHLEHYLGPKDNETNRSWTVLWPEEINKYQRKTSILKQVKKIVKADIKYFAESDPKYWDDYISYEDYVWGGYNGQQYFSIYYKKQSGHKNTYEIYFFH